MSFVLASRDPVVKDRMMCTEVDDLMKVVHPKGFDRLEENGANGIYGPSLQYRNGTSVRGFSNL